jgi:hypothetical protein
MEIMLESLPKKQKLIYMISNTENFNLKDGNIKILKYKDEFNIYRFDKILDTKIKPFNFMYYYKNTQNRSNISTNKINVVNKISDNEWSEEFYLHDKIVQAKVICDDYQMISYIVDNDGSGYDFLNFKIRMIDNNYLMRLEIAFTNFNFEHEIQLKNQIKLINELEKVILNQMNKN